jgi:hypothetical protein
MAVYSSSAKTSSTSAGDKSGKQFVEAATITRALLGYDFSAGSQGISK